MNPRPRLHQGQTRSPIRCPARAWRPGGTCLRVAFLAVLLAPAPAAAQAIEAVGMRALGMGGAFVAVADDASATYWNPAGLVTGSVFSAVAEYGRAKAEDIALPPGPVSARRGAASGTGTLLALGTWPVGMTVYRIATAAAVVTEPQDSTSPAAAARLDRLATTHVGVNVLQTIVSGLHVGATVKYVYGSAGVGDRLPAPTDPLGDAEGLDTRGSNRFDMDAGLIAELRAVKLGLTVRNLFEPEFDTPVAGTRLALERQVRAGVAVRPTDRLILSFDADLTRTPDLGGERRSMAAGAEQRLWHERLAVRGGFRVSTVGESRATVTTGGSVSLRSGLHADGYLAIGVADSAGDGFGLGLRLTF